MIIACVSVVSFPYAARLTRRMLLGQHHVAVGGGGDLRLHFVLRSQGHKRGSLGLSRGAGARVGLQVVVQPFPCPVCPVVPRRPFGVGEETQAASVRHSACNTLCACV